MRHLTPVVFVLAIASTAALSAQDVPPAGDALEPYRAQLTDWTETGRAVGLAAVVLSDTADHGSVMVFGQVQRAETRHLQVQSLFEIGSITKGFTGILLADMVLRGEVALDDPVAKYLPAEWELPAGGDTPITLLDLATHSSGLPRIHPGFMPADVERPYLGTDATTLRDALRATGLARPADAGYAYSNLGVALLGFALAHRAGKPYDELLRERVLEPLGMRDAYLHVADAPADRLVSGHQAQMLPVAHWELAAYTPAGGLITSAATLTHLLAAMLHPDDSPVGRAIALATTPVRSLGAGADSIGLAWHLMNRNGHRVIWHNGGTGGFRSFLGVDRGAERAAAFLNNTSFAWTDAVGLALVLGDTLPTLPAARAVTPLELTPAEREGYLGRYTLTPQVTITVAAAGDHLTAQLTGQGALRLVADEPDHFVVVVAPAALRFERDAAGSVEAVVLIQGGREQRAPREG